MNRLAVCVLVSSVSLLDIGSTWAASGKTKKSTKRERELKKGTKKTKQQNTVPNLVVQEGNGCLITQEDEGRYTLRATVGIETVAFSERPDRLAKSMATQYFVESFEEIFATSNPNGAITLGAANHPFVAVFSQPNVVGTTNVSEDSTIDIKYTLTQSVAQEAVGSIKQFVDTAPGVGSCSIFIDSGSFGPCVPPAGPWPGGESNNSGENPYITCFNVEGTDEYCWSKSYWAGGEWSSCTPYDDNFSYLSGPQSTCGKGCTEFIYPYGFKFW